MTKHIFYTRNIKCIMKISLHLTKSTSNSIHTHPPQFTRRYLKVNFFFFANYEKPLHKNGFFNTKEE